MVRPSFPRLARGISLLVLSLSSLALAACSRTFDVRGRVVGFGDDNQTVIVEHEEIPGFMPAMTMPFQADSSVSVADLEVGQAIAFEFVVTRDGSWIQHVEPLPDDALPRHPAAANATGLPVPTGTPILQVGDAVPPFELVDQAGEPITRADYDRQPLLLTFIYTRCPVPDFCPLMSRNFQTLQDSLTARYGHEVQQLSISIDPGYDTPAVLRDYAARYTSNTDQWTFATGSAEQVGHVAQMFGVFYQTEGPTIAHNLATVLIAPDGTVAAIWRGNEWTPGDVLDAVRKVRNHEAPTS